ncbi:unnamed protein product [Pleuronectes platessa]|uniref:Uncharacterized protein n=1 Tax=Pleuronectes platessa TaxID=8262 RepID=A0A9N7YJX3_PLEPL|nr:unnamed protein product [Pleuronectes platessa]
MFIKMPYEEQDEESEISDAEDLNCVLQDQAGVFWLLGASRGAPPEGAPPARTEGSPAGAVAEVIREKGPTRVQSRCRRPPYPVPSNGPPSAPATDTAPRSKRKKAPHTTDAVRHSRIGPPPKK